MSEQRTDHMTYLPDMEILEDSDIGERVLARMKAYDYTRYTQSALRI